MTNGGVKTVHFGQAVSEAPGATAAIRIPPKPQSGPAGAQAAREYERPDITLLGSIRMAVDQMRVELKVIGEEKSYITGLRVLAMQARIIAQLSEELIRRYDRAGGPPE